MFIMQLALYLDAVFVGWFNVCMKPDIIHFVSSLGTYYPCPTTRMTK
jgi:hypothetical protein